MIKIKVLEAEIEKENICLENVKSIAKGLHVMWGDKSEIIIHDLKQPESSVIFVAGELTNRDLGAPITDLVLRTIKNNQDPEDILNYKINTNDGRVFKSSTIFIKNEAGQVEFCLCINIDLTEILMTQNIISNFTKTKAEKSDQNSQHENFAKNIDEILLDLIERAKSEVDKPIPYMTKEDKLKIIKFLDDRGAFTITKSVETVAEEMNVSKFTVYNYLKEIKNDELEN